MFYKERKRWGEIERAIVTETGGEKDRHRATDWVGGGKGDRQRAGDDNDSADDALRAVLRTSYLAY